jgi:hypothetical protein
MRKNGPSLYRIVMQYSATRFGLRQMAFDRLRSGRATLVSGCDAQPTTSIISIARVMEEEVGELILQARFGGMPGKVMVEGEWTFRKTDLKD